MATRRELKDRGVPRRKDHVLERHQTEGKDDAANKIEAVVAAGKWPMNTTDLAKEIGWSRSHTQSVLKQYFEFEDESESESENETDAMAAGDESDAEWQVQPVELEDSEPRGMTIRVPAGMDARSYLQGFIDGMNHG